MSTNNIDYQKAIDTLDNTFPPSKGFVDISTIKSESEKALCAQNNTIIELLTRINQKLDSISQIQATISHQPSSDFTNVLNKINSSLSSFSLDNKKVVKSVDQKIVVWKDPTTLFPKKNESAGTSS